MVVIGAGRIGGALRTLATAVGVDVVLVDRTSGDDALSGAAGEPILLAVRNDDLPEVIARVPAQRRRDLVFLQNGAIRTILADAGLGGNTRGLLYVMVAARGADPVPGGTSWLCGPHAAAVAGFFCAIGIPAEVVDWARFSYYELEKLLWLACHGPLCEAHDATVGEIGSEHRGDLAALATELATVGRAAWGVDADPTYLVDRLVAYSASIPDYRASVKEWSTRNGWLIAVAEAHDLATPLHRSWLEATGHGPG